MSERESMIKSPSGNPEPPYCGVSKPVAAALVCVTVLGFALRCYELGNQPIWEDDLYTLASLKAPDFGTYIAVIRTYGPDHVPFYFLSVYFWTRLLGISAATVRFFSVLLGTASIPLLFALGRSVLGQRAGLAAALLLALSPMEILQSRTPRPYALLFFLALVSVYGLVKACRTDSKLWWGVNVVANALLIWSHYFAAFIPFAELCFLFLTRPRALRSIVRWGLIQAVLLSPLVLWYLKTPHDPPDSGVKLPLRYLLLVVFAQDEICIGVDALDEANPLRVAPGFIADLRPHLGGVFPLLSQLCVLLFIVRSSVIALRLLRGGGGPNARRQLVHAALLMLLLTVPPLSLDLLAWVWRGCVLPRYLSYVKIPIYLIMGSVLMPFRRLRYSMVGLAICCGLLAYQDVILMYHIIGTDRVSAAEYLRAKAAPNDVILVKNVMMEYDQFRHHLGETSVPCLPVFTYRALCKRCIDFFGQAAARLPDARKPGRVWTVSEPSHYAEDFDREFFEGSLTSCGLRFSCRHFGGQDLIAVYCIEPGPGFQPCYDCVLAENKGEPDYDGVLGRLGIEAASGSSYHKARAVLSDFVPTTEFLGRGAIGDVLFLSLGVHGAEALDVAKRAAEWAIQQEPEMKGGYLALGRALSEEGRSAEARAALETAASLNGGVLNRFMGLFEPLFQCLYVTEDFDAAEEELRKLESWGLLCPHTLRIKTLQNGPAHFWGFAAPQP